jgi:hypothetical protein
MGWGGGPGHYVVTKTRDEVELGFSWAVTIENDLKSNLVVLPLFCIAMILSFEALILQVT